MQAMNDRKVEVKITGNFWFSLILVAIRAFQPNAQPMNEWSLFSWFLMTLPVTYVFFLFGLAGILIFLSYIIDFVLSFLRKFH